MVKKSMTSKEEFDKRYNNVEHCIATSLYLQEALTIKHPGVDMKKLEEEIVKLVKEHTGESDLQVEAVLRYISAVRSMKLMRKQLMTASQPCELVE